MHTVTNFARHLLQYQPDKDASRLCLYHYMVHHCVPHAPLTPEVFNKFCRRALTHSYWRENKQVLADELQYSVQNYMEAFEFSLDFKSIDLPSRIQVIELEKDLDHLQIVESFLDDKVGDEDKVRIFPYDNDLIAVILKKDGSLEVRYFYRLTLIEGGMLKPLCDDLQLIYDHRLELKPNCIQHWPIDKSVTARFSLEGDGFHGRLIRGYVFQNYETLNGGNGHLHPELFYRIKKVERLFIEKQSDNNYQELLKVLERANELLDMGHPEAETLAKQAIERGKVAFQHVYYDDNSVRILLQKLQNNYSKRLRKPIPQNIL